MKLVALCLLSLAACAVDLDPTTESETDALGGTICDDWMCGTNSPAIDGFGFHELNIDGVVDSDGWTLGPLNPRTRVRLAPLRWGKSTYRVAVVAGALVASKLAGDPSDPNLLSHQSLLGASLVLGHAGEVYLMTIEDVSRETPFWAHYPNTTPAFETYELRWRHDGEISHGTEVCPQPADDDILTMDVYHATVFEGERIDARTKTIAPDLDTRWFNVGCAGSTLAKLQLTGHTYAAQLITANQSIPFSTTIPQRQTMIKMLSADYCGHGTPFTVGGEPLHWADDQGTMSLGLLGGLTNALEAEWTPNGASCLNTPRLLANPPATMPPGLTSANLLSSIATTCGGVLPPQCPTSSPPGTHLWSYNPHALILP